MPAWNTTSILVPAWPTTRFASFIHGRTYLTRLSRTFGQGALPEKKSRKRRTKAEVLLSGLIPTRRKKKAAVLAGNGGNSQLVKAKRSVTTPRKRSDTVNAGISLPPRLTKAKAAEFHDLPTFLQYVARTGKGHGTSWFKGVFYEFQVQKTLRSFLFELQRSGGKDDHGIDLAGHWHLPNLCHKVIIQCKNTKPHSVMIRELGGTFDGAPAGWQGDGTLAFLVTPHPITKPMRMRLEISHRPMCYMQLTGSGKLEQLMWNKAADLAGLEGLSTAKTYIQKSDDVNGGDFEEIATLYWKGERLEGRSKTCS